MPAALRSPCRQRRRLLLALAAGLALGGCGFQLRGAHQFSFSSVHINLPASSTLGGKLRRLFAIGADTTVSEDPARADVQLQILASDSEREILSLTGSGKVREYQLTRSLRYQLLDTAGNTLIAPSLLQAQREYTFDDSQIHGKEQEEAMLYVDMEDDLLQQLMRRLARFQRQP